MTDTPMCVSASLHLLSLRCVSYICIMHEVDRVYTRRWLQYCVPGRGELLVLNHREGEELVELQVLQGYQYQ